MVKCVMWLFSLLLTGLLRSDNKDQNRSRWVKNQIRGNDTKADDDTSDSQKDRDQVSVSIYLDSVTVDQNGKSALNMMYN